MTQPWQPLKPGDRLALIAPAGALSFTEIMAAKARITSWGLSVKMPPDLLGEDLLCANTDERRLSQLLSAVYDDEVAAIWCLRGGYGCTRLWPSLAQQFPPARAKLFLGFSDITALHIFFHQQWGWQTLHAPSARQVALDLLPPENIACLRQCLMGEISSVCLPDLLPLNTAAQATVIINTAVVGGNLSLVLASLGTPWQLKTQAKTLFLEEVNERAYRVDRALTQLDQAGLLNPVDAVIFGNMTTDLKENDKMTAILERFAATCKIPVFKTDRIGHGPQNYPLPLNSPAALVCGVNAQIVFDLNS